MLENRHKLSFVFLGASFATGNLGVSALAWSSINLISQKWPEAEFSILGGRSFRQEDVQISGEKVLSITYLPVRYSPKLFMANHILWMLLSSLLPSGRSIFLRKGSTLEAVSNTDVFFDITGGDSFSDIYGLKRLIMGYLLKRLCQLSGKQFIMLPQTYGPFKSKLAQRVAKKVLKKANVVYSRDKEGLDCVQYLIGPTEKLILSPDVAFTLEPRKPQQMASSIQQVANENNVQVIGLNISGLLYNGGYTGKNEFNLCCDYKKMLTDIVNFFGNIPDTKILLVPHVVPENWETENDLLACQKFRESLPESLRSKVLIAKPETGPFYDQCEIKYIIGLCNFFLGSRMHATIAAISQCIPTVGLAYSKKFAGVYETAGVEDCVVDLRTLSHDQVMDKIKSIYENRVEIRQKLERRIPQVKQQVYSIFDNINL